MKVLQAMIDNWKAVESSLGQENKTCCLWENPSALLAYKLVEKIMSKDNWSVYYPFDDHCEHARHLLQRMINMTHMTNEQFEKFRQDIISKSDGVFENKWQEQKQCFDQRYKKVVSAILSLQHFCLSQASSYQHMFGYEDPVSKFSQTLNDLPRESSFLDVTPPVSPSSFFNL